MAGPQEKSDAQERRGRSANDGRPPGPDDAEFWKAPAARYEDERQQGVDAYATRVDDHHRPRRSAAREEAIHRGSNDHRKSRETQNAEIRYLQCLDLGWMIDASKVGPCKRNEGEEGKTGKHAEIEC